MTGQSVLSDALGKPSISARLELILTPDPSWERTHLHAGLRDWLDRRGSMRHLLTIAILARAGQPMATGGLGWKQDSFRSGHCLAETGWDHVDAIRHDALGHLARTQIAGSVWSGSPRNFTEYHLEQALQLRSQHVSLFGARVALRTFRVEGFRAGRATFISGLHTCPAAELCELRFHHDGRGWRVMFERRIPQLSPRFASLLEGARPSFVRRGGHFSLLVAGHVRLQVAFTPIVWGDWRQTYISQRYGIPLLYFFCSATTFAPSINGIPDGWLSYQLERM